MPDDPKDDKPVTTDGLMQDVGVTLDHQRKTVKLSPYFIWRAFLLFGFFIGIGVVLGMVIQSWRGSHCP